jgi:hypothetical protein
LSEQGGGVKIDGVIVTRQIFGAETVYQVQTELGLIFVRDFLTPRDTSSVVELFVAYRDLHFFDELGKRMEAITDVHTMNEPVRG